MNKHKVKHHRNSDTKTANRDHIRTTALERSVMNCKTANFIVVFQASLILQTRFPEDVSKGHANAPHCTLGPI